MTYIGKDAYLVSSVNGETGDITTYTPPTDQGEDTFLAGDGTYKEFALEKIGRVMYATAGQTEFTVTYNPEDVAVYLNGARLIPDDYTAENGTSIILASGANLDDIVDVVSYLGATNASEPEVPPEPQYSNFTVKIDSSLTPGTADQMAIFFFSTVGDVTVNWGDGQSSTVNGIDQNISHDYATSGLYDVEIIGSGAFKLAVSSTSTKYNFEDSYHILGIEAAGEFAFTSCKDLFRQVKTDFYINGNIDFSGVSDMRSMFALCENFNDDISGWDTTGVSLMYLIFQDALAFNQDISSWNVSGVANMYAMFWGAEAFNQDISAWDTSGATAMNVMFRDALAFNQDISSWDVSGVTNCADFNTNSGLQCVNTPALPTSCTGC